jgi:hypothetical protein
MAARRETLLPESWGLGVRRVGVCWVGGLVGDVAWVWRLIEREMEA